MSLYITRQWIRMDADSAGPLQRVFSFHHLEARGLDPDVAAIADKLRSTPHVALHVRRGDQLNSRMNREAGGWFSGQSHYMQAIDYLIESEFGTSDFNLAVFSDDLDFVEANESAYGLDRVTGDIRFIRGNNHFKSIFDSYLMSLCPIIVGSVGGFASTTSLLAAPPSTYIRSQPNDVHVLWQRTAQYEP